MVIGHPFRHDVRTGTDGLRHIHSKVLCLRRGFRIQNGHGGGGKFRRETGVRFSQRNGKMRVVCDGETFQGICFAVQNRLAAEHLQRDIGIHGRLLQETLKGEPHIGGGQRVAVGEHDAVPQSEAVGQPVFTDGIIRHEAVHHFGGTAGGPRFEQPVIHIHGDQVVICGFRQVHGGNIIADRGPQQAGFHVFRTGSNAEYQQDGKQ